MYALLASLILCIFPMAETPPSSVMLIGDSITAEHQERIENNLADCGISNVTIDAESGRLMESSSTPFGYIPSGLDVLSSIEEENRPDVYIIELGVNDINVGNIKTEADARRLIDSALSHMSGAEKIYWVTTWRYGSEENTNMFNQVLSTYDQVELIRWDRDAIFFTPDGLHPNWLGADVMSNYYCEILGAT